MPGSQPPTSPASPPAPRAHPARTSPGSSLLARWRDGFDWRAFEDRIEALGYLESTTADGRRLAAIYATADEGAPARLPLLLVHGWPDSPMRFLDLVPMLTAAGHDVVAPAIPGFWFSDEPEGEMSRDLAAADFHALMTELGHERYAVHAGDWGSSIAQTIALQHPDAVAALHLTDVPFDLGFTIDRENASPAEVAYLDATETFGQEALYLLANTTQPTMFATILADTPFGLATWLGSLYDAWSERRLEDDAIIANAALTYLTGTVRSSIRLYSEPASSWDTEAWGEDSGESASDDAEGDWSGPDDGETDDAGSDWSGAAGWAPEQVSVPTAFALFPADLVVAPRELAERFFAVERFTIMPRGGHFAAIEEPELLAHDLLQFLADRS